MFRKIIKKFLVVCIIVIVISLPTLYNHLKNISNSDILNNLKGEIYYTKRIDGVKTLFKSDATLQNEILIYSHLGKGKTRHGNNDNIGDFYYDSRSKTLSFIAMNDGNRSLYSIKEGEENPKLINIIDFDEENTFRTNNTDYIKMDVKQITASQKKGSIYIIEDGEEKCVKKFYGIYDEKFTGYFPIGFSPDGKYLIYYSWEHLTPFGTILEGIISGSPGNKYIMDLSSGDSTRFINATHIQWITD